MSVNSQIRERILNAVSVLQAQGVESPTNEQVREAMGGGSLSHISPVMREWRESRKSGLTAALEIPGELKRSIEMSLSQVWSAAGKLAGQRIDSVQAEAESAIRAAGTERDEALSEVSRLEEILKAVKQELLDTSARLDVTENRLVSLTEQLTRVSAENASLKAHLDEKSAAAEVLREELKEARSDNRKLQGELVEIARKSSR